MKRKALAPQAEEMYVCNQMEFKEIAIELKVSERSLRVWAKRDNWKEKRSRFLDRFKTYTSELLDFNLSLMRHIRNIIDNGGDPSATKAKLFLGINKEINARIRPKEAPADDDAGDKPQQDPIEAVKQFLGL